MRILLAICIESYENKRINLFSWIENFHTLLRQHEICAVIIGKKGVETRDLDGNCRVITFPKGVNNIFRINRIVKDFKPDLLYIQGLFAKEVLYYLVVNKVRHLKMLLAPLGELSSDKMETHSRKKQSYLGRLRYFGLFNYVDFQSRNYEELREIAHRLLPKPEYKYTHTIEIPKASEAITDEMRDLYNAALQNIVSANLT